jgi:hypothetical protein
MYQAFEDVGRRFDYRPASERTGPMHEEARAACRELAEKLAEILPDGREKSLAITNLEQAMFWANAAIARNEAS